jgi:SagB-type dehydrogenase family enzyme
MTKKDAVSNSEAFDAFWEASAYSQYNLKEFAAAQEEYSAKEKSDALLEYPATYDKLPISKSKVNDLAKKRGSVRVFGDKPLSKREFATLLSSFYAFNGLEHRSYPSAGASYSVEVFSVANNIDGFTGKVLYYNPDEQAVSVIGAAPSWSELSSNINVTTSGMPHCVFIFVLFPNRLTAKYLERGGRFGLIEVGAAMQQLALQIAGSKNLKGVAAGGLVDNYWLQVLRLDPNEAKVALGYLCGK